MSGKRQQERFLLQQIKACFINWPWNKHRKSKDMPVKEANAKQNIQGLTKAAIFQSYLERTFFTQIS